MKKRAKHDQSEELEKTVSEITEGNIKRKKPGENNALKGGFTAFLGLVKAGSEESSVRGFLIAGGVIFMASLISGMAFVYSAIILLVWSIVVSFEIMNTAFEALVDYVSDGEFHELIGSAKDMAAGTVFVVASIAWILSALIFFTHFF